MSCHLIVREHIIRVMFFYQTTVICMPGVTFYVDSEEYAKAKWFHNGFEMYSAGHHRIKDDELQHVEYGEYNHDVTGRVLKENLEAAQRTIRVEQINKEERGY